MSSPFESHRPLGEDREPRRRELLSPGDWHLGAGCLASTWRRVPNENLRQREECGEWMLIASAHRVEGF